MRKPWVCAKLSSDNHAPVPATATIAISEFRQNGERTNAISSLAPAGQQTFTTAAEGGGRWRRPSLRRRRRGRRQTRPRRGTHHAADTGSGVPLDDLPNPRPDTNGKAHEAARESR